MSERERFEAWFRSKVGASHEDLRNRHEYGYASDEIQRQWRAWQAALADRPEQPIDMVLHCPKCGLQHIDASEPNDAELGTGLRNGWGNPPHRSHLCHICGHIWRPADVPTNGVVAIKTAGKADSPVARPKPAQPMAHEPVGMVVDNEAALFDRFKGKLGNDTLLYAAPVARPEPAQPVALPWASIESAPREGTLLLAKIVGNPEHRTALWWAVTGHWSTKWGNWNDGVEPSGLAGPTHWLPINAHGVGAAPPSHPAPSEAAHELDWTKCPRCAIAVYVKKDPQCPRCGWDTREAINGNV